MQVKTQAKRKKRPKWHKRWWFKLLLRVAGSVATGAIVAAVIDIATTVSDQLKSVDFDTINPSSSEIEAAKSILRTKAIPLINHISSEVESIRDNSALLETKIASLNSNLNKIEILQAWVEHRMDYEKEKVDLMVAALIEPLLIKLKLLINGIIISQLQNNVEKQMVSFTPSNTTNIENLNLPWNSVVTSSYEKLVYVSQSNTITIINPSVDNPELVEELESTDVTTTLPQENNNKDDTVKIVIGIGAIAFLFKLLSNYNDE